LILIDADYVPAARCGCDFKCDALVVGGLGVGADAEVDGNRYSYSFSVKLLPAAVVEPYLPPMITT
jgi:hypothetical protein